MSRSAKHILITGGNYHWQPRLKAIAGDVETAVLCRRAALQWQSELEGNERVVTVPDDAPVEEWLAVGQVLHGEWRIDAIASFGDMDQDKTAAIAADLGIDFHSIATVKSIVNKSTMRARLAQTGVESLPYQLVEKLRDLQGFFDRVGPPLVVKPSRGRSSAGLSVVRDRVDLGAAFQRAREARTPRMEPSIPIAERYVEGPEFSVEAITHHGRHYLLAVTEKFKDDTTKVEVGHVIPAALDEAAEATVLAHVQRVLTALGVESGLTHTEVILAAGGPTVVETHLRKGGDRIEDLVHDATGVDMADLFVRQIAGEAIESRPELSERSVRPRYRAGSAIGYLAPDLEGTLLGIEGWGDVASLPGVREWAQLVADGSRLDGLRSSHSRLGFVRVQAESSDAAAALLESALGKLFVRHRRDS
jgi:biotin carboxylase